MAANYPDKRVRRSTADFQNALFSLMEKNAFNDITITQIVNTAGYNRGTFYSHYKKKEDLLQELMDDMFEKMVKAYRQSYIDLSVIDLNEMPAESIVFFNHFYENKRFYKLMLEQRIKTNFTEKLIKQLDTLFRNDFRYPMQDNKEIDIYLFMSYRVYGTTGLIVEWIENDFQHSPSYLASQIVRIYSSCTPVVYVREGIRG
ncbi:TetR/AcrR family transcriptional regulator [Virgibacillus sp. 179-BFC.A HS]|uniref:TetR/AcrR family transcriptional regulator n=1 Tax=Tigheibacillus jepli TaxID=3035914 RepID=A0ABU5CEM0_9BACI|nr:TetR/AcrR family transcriptional regulator [Virgibacillus sp. 179-BFC.A HS]MDY0404782.1 TetR/AcrR family transcriptional regulator [Virgibacillus sp. 179-BFC.A HS]